MAAKKKAAPVDPFQEYEQRLGKLEDQIRDMDEGVAHSFADHDLQLEGLREDLIGRDRVIWVVLDQHNSRIHEIKHHILGVVGEGDPEPKLLEAAVVPDENQKPPTWFTVLVLLGFVALAIVVGYGLQKLL